MFKLFSNLFSKDTEVTPEPAVSEPRSRTYPIDELDELLHKAMDDWMARQPQVSKFEALECWIERKDNLEGTTWVVRLQPLQPLYIKRHKQTWTNSKPEETPTQPQ